MEDNAPRTERQQDGQEGPPEPPPSTSKAPPRCGTGAGRCRGGASSLRGVHGGRLGCAAAARSLGSTAQSGGGLRSDPQAASGKTPRPSAGISAGLPLLQSPAGGLSGGTGAGSGDGTARAQGGHPRAAGQRGRRSRGSPRSHGCHRPQVRAAPSTQHCTGCGSPRPAGGLQGERPRRRDTGSRLGQRRCHEAPRWPPADAQPRGSRQRCPVMLGGAAAWMAAATVLCPSCPCSAFIWETNAQRTFSSADARAQILPALLTL